MSRGEKQFLKDYDPENYERPSVSVECALFTIIDSELKVLLTQRASHPFKGVWALPGSFVQVSNKGRQGEDIEEAAHRALSDATGLPQHTAFLEQLQTFGKAGRDPRMRVISVAWFALLSPNQARDIETDSKPIQWFSAEEDVPWMRLAFDHAEILDCAVKQLKAQMDTSHIAFHLVDDVFTVGELRDTHEAVTGKHYDARNFRRRFQRMIDEGFVVEAPGKRHRGSARPAKVWRYTP